MPKYKYLNVGGGMTGDAAFHGIRAINGDRSIGLIWALSAGSAFDGAGDQCHRVFAVLIGAERKLI